MHPFYIRNLIFDGKQSMMKRLYLILFVISFHTTLFGLNITIIESQTAHTGLVADAIWSEVATSLGHTPTIVPYQTLDDTLFFTDTDVLIISAGTNGLSQASVGNVLAFIKTGKPVYLQCEYLPIFTTNIAFSDIVHSLEGTFKWENIVSGDIIPMNVLGTYATTPNQIDSLDYFWYSVSGKGDCNMINFLEYGGEFHGFQYVPENLGYGSISTTSDGDWVHERASLALMENILVNLITPPPYPQDQRVRFSEDSTFCKGETLLLQTMPTDANYVWQDGSTESYFIVEQEGIYEVTVELDCGEVTDSIFVKEKFCDCAFFTPNIFSPNNDLINDEFSAIADCELFDFSMLIYNRWGELIFQSNDQVESWDGTQQGENSPTGVYAYLIRYSLDDQVKYSYGDVTLIR